MKTQQPPTIIGETVASHDAEGISFLTITPHTLDLAIVRPSSPGTATPSSGRIELPPRLT